jgi:hypothetical protein
MTLATLREELVRSSGNPAYRIDVDEDVQLSDSHKAEVHRRCDGILVRLAAGLSAAERDMAIAHELAHILLEYQWLEPVSETGVHQDGRILRELGNAISHPYVIDLASRHDVSSDLHLQERGANIDEFESYVPRADVLGDEPLFLGLVLFDIARTRPELGLRARSIAASNPGVQQAFDAAEQWLAPLNERSSRSEQRQAVASFMTAVP